MPLGELSVPSYLVPPSPVQRQQLDLEREQLKDRQRERASQQLMRAVGMAKMNKETQDLINQGVDETTARKRAFLNNAQLVMPPNADISHFITQDEAQEVRRASMMLNLAQREQALEERTRLATRALDLREDNLKLAQENAATKQAKESLEGLLKVSDAERKLVETQLKIERDSFDRERKSLSPPAQEAKDLADLKEQLRDSVRRSASPESRVDLETGKIQTEDISQEQRKQLRLQDQIKEMESRRHAAGTLGEKETAVENLQDAVNKAAASGDQAALKEALAKQDRQLALLYPKGTKLSSVSPITGKTEVKTVGGTTAEEDALSASTRSKLQQELEGTIQAAKTIHDIEHSVNWSTVGPIAYMGEKVGRYGLLGPTGVVTGQSGAAGRAAIRGGKLDLLRELETKGHASATVMKAVEETLPHLGMFETPEGARTALQERKRNFIAQGLNQAKQLGIKAPPDLIRLLATYPSTEIKRMMEQRIIPAEDAQAAYSLQYQKWSTTTTAPWLKQTNKPVLNP